MEHTTPVHLRKIKRPGKNGKVRHEWHLRWHGIDGKHYCKKLGNVDRLIKREAEAQRRAFQEALNRREIPRDKPASMTILEFAEYHKKMIGQDRRPTTVYEYGLAARLASEILGNRKTIQSVSPADVALFRNRLRGSAATRAKHISRLRAMFNHAKRWGLIHGDNPFANQPMPRYTARSMRVFSVEETEAMVEAAKTVWWRTFILVAVTSGPRKEEMLNLTWRDIDWDQRTIGITPKKAKPFTGPDGREYETLAWEPKTYSLRTIPIPDQTVEALRDLQGNSDGSPYVFVSLERLGRINEKMRSGERRDRAETCNNILRDFRAIQKRAAARLGVGDWECGSVHDLRRTYGTRMADVVPIHVLRLWLGHSDVSVTARFYLGQTEGHAERAREALLPRQQL